MVLGKPGAGKSVFGLLLLLGLIRTRTPHEPLPVLIAINTWDPAEPVETFVARRLTEEHPDVLAPYGDPTQVAERLVEQDAPADTRRPRRTPQWAADAALTAWYAHAVTAGRWW